MKQALKDAQLQPDQIDEVVLVGGSTRIPRVRQVVKELFKREPHTELNPDEVVALGAAVQANILGGGSEATKDMLLLDVTPLSLGIELLAEWWRRSFIATRRYRLRLPNISPPAWKVRRALRSTCCKASASWRKTVACWRDLI